MHGLAAAIDPHTLDDDGAENLLLPQGYCVLNQDGIAEEGVAQEMHFPPPDAPPAFLKAWFQATKGLDSQGYMEQAMTFMTAFHPITADGNVTAGLPTDQLASYQTIVDDYLYELSAYRGMLAPGQYQRDEPFFSRLQSLLQSTPTDAGS